ncbi:hypothetical protein FQR65_LT00928 [Abscondita terminalis]|nr:hypothetical protein FQR65_LT00928 [Abscondita terminalis]
MRGIQAFFILLLCCTCQIHKTNGFLYEEYYWQDFEGEIPTDAFPGGKDVNGKPIYVGQVFFASKLLPAKIYEHDKKAYFAWGYELSQQQMLKYCAPKIRKDSSGWEPSYDLYIGRAFYKQETLVGRIRVFGTPASNLGLYISADGKEVILDSFEVLTYVPDINSTEIRHCERVVILNH